jgi:hypothetical protein
MPETLTVFCPLGLANRLRVLLSGLVLARASGRVFKMLWPLTGACAAPFEMLFDSPWNVETVSPQSVEDLPYIPGWFGRLPDLLNSPEKDIIVGHPGWLLRPEQYPAHRRLMEDECAALLAELRPASEIRAQAEAFRRAHFRPQMIGVHLRRGDFVHERPDTAHNSAAALEAVQNFLAEWPNAGILLCSDDGAPRPGQRKPTRTENIQRLFANHFAERLVTFEAPNLDRSQVEAVRQALLEFYLLRQTSAFVGTLGSSFSEMVAFGQTKPHRLTAGAAPGYQIFEMLARKTRLYEILKTLGRRDTGRDLPFPVLWRYYSRAPLRWLRNRWRRQG